MPEQLDAGTGVQHRSHRHTAVGPDRGALLGKLFIAALIPIVLYSLSVLGELFVQTYRITQDTAYLRAEVEYEKQQNIQLQRELNYARSDQAIEDAARRHLNLIKPGDNPIVLSGANAFPTAAPTTARRPERAPASDAFLEWVSWVLARHGR